MSRQTSKVLTPTKNPFSFSIHIPHQQSKTLKNDPEKLSRKDKPLHNDKEKFLKSLSSTCQIERSSKQNQVKRDILIQDDFMSKSNHSFDKISNKIDDILKNYDYPKKEKLNNKQPKENQKEKVKICKQNKLQKPEVQSQDQKSETKVANKPKWSKVSKNTTSIANKNLQDITIHYINYPNKLGSQKSKQTSKDKSLKTLSHSLQIPKVPKANPNKKFQQQMTKKTKKFQLQHELNCNPQPITLSTDLEQLQASEDNINEILSNLQRDFLPPKNTDYFVFSQQEIKIPKIFRKSKTNNLMYKSCTQTKLSKDSRLQSYKSVLIQKNTVRKSQIFQSSSLIQRQMHSFLTGLKTQIYLDSQFKKVKQWFLYNKTEDKWNKLQKQLRANKLWVNELTMKVIFMHQQQGNPFQSIDDGQYTVKQLILSFIAAQQHWNQYILQKFDDKLLTCAGLIENVLDSSKKGYISIEDLIRFLHCKLKEFYYTRDLSMIYLRLKGGQKLQFQQLISKISKKAC